MKNIKNKETKILHGEKFLHRSDLFKLVINESSEKGILIPEMRIRLKILDVLDKAGTKDIKLEDYEFNLLKTLFNNYGWIGNHIDLVETADHLEEVSKQS